MNTPTSPNKKGEALQQRTPKTRVSPKTRQAIQYLVKYGCTQNHAAELAGMNHAALSRALAKPHTKKELEDAKANFIKEIQGKKALYKALAWEQAHNLAQNAKSEAIKLKAVELLTSEGRGTSPAVSVTVNTGNGYEFVRPGQRLVDIEGTPDHASSVEDAEVIDNTEESDDIEE